MTALFELVRGFTPFAPPAPEVVLRVIGGLGPPPAVPPLAGGAAGASGPSLMLSLAPTPWAGFHHQGKVTTVPFEPLPSGDGVELALAPFLTNGRSSTRPPRLLALARPWDAPWEETVRALAARPERWLLLAAVGELDGVWYDGPLAHGLGDGGIASYVPTGGPAALRLPLEPTPELRGVALPLAFELDGSRAELAHRTLLARIDHRLGPPGPGPLAFSLGRPCLVAALALALVRQARPQSRILVQPPAQPTSLPPPWRRFAQNAGLHWIPTPDPVDPATGQRRTVDLVALTSALPEEWHEELRERINALSDVIPRTLV